ncbi:Tim44/TimA family putative adaptor protein [Allorhizobium sp. BGMRC 0089]|uniref:Tim44/TimA family putative adaptor protein n=1 Tax=Allorhizobium sonneratiae TaxID=2934936 RepID=UPI002033D742|nr:Tim44/TimA family putative adaptor protein [Allorhizobium sonneratiae]MCM2294407.1 Tim44/TimA family putative adaptor protein [Allorhizobium sonneratiae]
MGSNDFITLFFLVAAIIIFWQLRNVLGRRTGNEKPPMEGYSARSAQDQPPVEDARVVTLPKPEGEGEDIYAAIDAYCPPEKPLNASLREIVRVDPGFNPKEFLKGAGVAYEMIVTAFANGDRKTLKGLLSREVYEGFDQAMSEREKRGEVTKSTFVGIDKGDIVSASLTGSEEQITVRIVSQLISATFDRDGKLIDGDADSVGEVKDIWTFARDSRSRDPNWKLIATESEQ